MLVPNTTVWWMFGKGTYVFNRSKVETGAVISLLPADQLSTYAMKTDALLQEM